MKQPNVCLVVLDAVRARNLGCYGYQRQTTPQIDYVAREGVTFENCYSCINATDPSLTTILSGKYPATHGILTHGEIGDLYKEKISRIRFLQSILKSNGYTTVAVDWLGRWHEKGFDHYSGRLDKNGLHKRLLKTKPGKILYSWGLRVDEILRPAHLISYDNARAVTDYALGIVENHKDKKFFLFIHYWDPHIPYSPPREYLQKFQDEKYDAKVESIDQVLNSIGHGRWRRFMQRWMEKMENVEDVLARYDAEINYVDSQIGRLVQGMRELGIYDDTLFVITSDHGESLTEHGIYFDHHGLYDESIHVPLIIRYPTKLSKGTRVSALSQHVDLLPTICDLLELCATCDCDGKSLVPFIGTDIKGSRSFVFAEETLTQRKLCIRTDRWKYIFAPSTERAVCSYCGRVHGDLEELYDLQHDPDESVNIAKESKIKLKLHSAMLDFVTDLRRKKRVRQRLERKIKSLKTRGKI